jgi:hypothetical protein
VTHPRTLPEGEQDLGAIERQSIQPTYNAEKTGPRFTVESRLNGKRIALEKISDPFVFHRVVIGWRDLLGFILRGRSIEVVVSGDPEVVEDVCELNSDYLGRQDSSRRQEWNEQIERGLRKLGSLGDWRGTA